MRATTDNPYLFQTVKDRVDIVDTARHYGLNPDRNGWCLCPFHGEKTPSFHLHNQRFRCFGCEQRGDVVDLVSHLRSCSPMEAVKELNQVFCLGLDLEAPVDTLAVSRARAERREKERFRAWREGAVRTLTDHFRRLHETILHTEATIPEEIGENCTAALKELDKMEYYLDLVCFGAEEEVRAAAPVIEAVAARIRKGTNP